MLKLVEGVGVEVECWLGIGVDVDVGVSVGVGVYVYSLYLPGNFERTNCPPNILTNCSWYADGSMGRSIQCVGGRTPCWPRRKVGWQMMINGQFWLAYGQWRNGSPFGNRLVIGREVGGRGFLRVHLSRKSSFLVRAKAGNIMRLRPFVMPSGERVCLLGPSATWLLPVSHFTSGWWKRQYPGAFSW